MKQLWRRKGLYALDCSYQTTSLPEPTWFHRSPRRQTFHPHTPKWTPVQQERPPLSRTWAQLYRVSISPPDRHSQAALLYTLVVEDTRTKYQDTYLILVVVSVWLGESTRTHQEILINDRIILGGGADYAQNLWHQAFLWCFLSLCKTTDRPLPHSRRDHKCCAFHHWSNKYINLNIYLCNAEITVLQDRFQRNHKASVLVATSRTERSGNCVHYGLGFDTPRLESVSKLSLEYL